MASSSLASPFGRRFAAFAGLIAASAILAGCAGWGSAPAPVAVSPYAPRAELDVMRVRNPSDVAVIRVVPETVIWKGPAKPWSFTKYQVAWVEPPPPPPAPAPPPPPPKPPEPILIKAPQQISQTVHFAFDRTTLSRDAQQTLEALPTDNVMGVTVTAYTDGKGSEAYNDRLSARRAKVVAEFLTKRGFAPETIATKAMGKRDPVGDNKTEDGRAENRRAVVVVTVQVRAP